jgi:hypothetical protein
MGSCEAERIHLKQVLGTVSIQEQVRTKTNLERLLIQHHQGDAMQKGLHFELPRLEPTQDLGLERFVI